MSKTTSFAKPEGVKFEEPTTRRREGFRNVTMHSRASLHITLGSQGLSKYDPRRAKFFFLSSGFFTILGFCFSFPISNSCERTSLPLPSLHYRVGPTSIIFQPPCKTTVAPHRRWGPAGAAQLHSSPWSAVACPRGQPSPTPWRGCQ
jgi:hypothetical protein